MELKKNASSSKPPLLLTESKHISKLFGNQQISPEIRAYISQYIESLKRFELTPNKGLAALGLKAQECLFINDYEQNLIFNLQALAYLKKDNLTTPLNQQIYCTLCTAIGEVILRFSDDTDKIVKILNRSGYASESDAFCITTEAGVLMAVKNLLMTAFTLNSKENILNHYELVRLFCNLGDLYLKQATLGTNLETQKPSFDLSLKFYKKALDITPVCSLIRNHLIHKIFKYFPSEYFNKGFQEVVRKTCDKKYFNENSPKDILVVLNFVDPYFLITGSFEMTKFILLLQEPSKSMASFDKSTLVLFPPVKNPDNYSTSQSILHLQRGIALIDLSLVEEALGCFNRFQIPTHLTIDLREALNEASMKIHKKIENIIDGLIPIANMENIELETAAQKNNFKDELEQVMGLNRALIRFYPFSDADKRKKAGYGKYFSGMYYLLLAKYNELRGLEFKSFYEMAYKSFEEALKNYKFINFYFQIATTAMLHGRFQEALDYCKLWQQMFPGQRNYTFIRKDSAELTKSLEKKANSMLNIQLKLQRISDEFSRSKKIKLPHLPDLGSDLTYRAWRKISNLIKKYEVGLKDIKKHIDGCEYLFSGTKKYHEINIYENFFKELDRYNQDYNQRQEKFRCIKEEFDKIPIPIEKQKIIVKNIDEGEPLSVPESTGMQKKQNIESEKDSEVAIISEEEIDQGICQQLSNAYLDTLQDEKKISFPICDLTKVAFVSKDELIEVKNNSDISVLIPKEEKFNVTKHSLQLAPSLLSSCPMNTDTSSEILTPRAQEDEKKITKHPSSFPILEDTDKIFSEKDIESILTVKTRKALIRYCKLKEDLLKIGVEIRMQGSFPIRCCLFKAMRETCEATDVDVITDFFDKDTLLKKINDVMLKSGLAFKDATDAFMNFERTDENMGISVRFSNYQKVSDAFLLSNLPMDVTLEKGVLQFWMDAKSKRTMDYWIHRGKHPVIFPHPSDESARHFIYRIAKNEVRFVNLLRVTPILSSNQMLSKAEIIDYWNLYVHVLSNSQYHRIMHHIKSLTKMIESDVFSKGSSFKYIFYVLKGFLYSQAPRDSSKYSSEMMENAAKNMAHILQDFFKDNRSMATSCLTAIKLLNLYPEFLANDCNLQFFVDYLRVYFLMAPTTYNFEGTHYFFPRTHDDKKMPTHREMIPKDDHPNTVSVSGQCSDRT